MLDRMYPDFPVLMVDDEPHILHGMTINLAEAGINNVLAVSDSREVLKIVERISVEIIILDLTMPFTNGNELLQSINKEHPEIPVIVVTGNNTIESAVECIQNGAYDYLVKPVELNRLMTVIKRAIEIRDLKRENQELRNGLLSKTVQNPDAFSEFTTVNEKMHAVFRYMEAIAKTSEPVLITGETGSGKELIARAFHILSKRKGNFVTINAAGLDDQMFTDTLFGHKKGAFTDAQSARNGLIDKAAGGILFLDEIGDLSLASQVKLLRLLQEHEYYPLGSDDPQYTDALIIVATNQDLKELQEKGMFRKDLYYRLHAHHIHVPALRERSDDLPLLLDKFSTEAAEILGKEKPSVNRSVYSLLGNYEFPGNVRELRAMIIDSMSLAYNNELTAEHFKKSPIGKENSAITNDNNLIAYLSELQCFPTLKEIQHALIETALHKTDNNQTLAAQLLGITRQALNQRLKTGKDEE